MIGEGVVDQLTGAKAGGVEGPRQTPMVGPPALGLEDRSGRGKDARRLAEAEGRQAAEGRLGLLPLDQVRLAQHRQSSQGLAASDRCGVDALEQAREARRLLFRMGDLTRQSRQKGDLARFRVAGFQLVVEISLAHRALPAGRRQLKPATVCAVCSV